MALTGEVVVGCEKRVFEVFQIQVDMPANRCSRIGKPGAPVRVAFAPYPEGPDVDEGHLRVAVIPGRSCSKKMVQLLQKDALGASCPNDCRGLLGFAFDLEWIHFVYNASIEAGLIAIAVALRLWRAPRTLAWALLSTAVVVQGYHVGKPLIVDSQLSAAGAVAAGAG